jgi:hypothetical protein
MSANPNPHLKLGAGSGWPHTLNRGSNRGCTGCTPHPHIVSTVPPPYSRFSETQKTVNIRKNTLVLARAGKLDNSQSATEFLRASQSVSKQLGEWLFFYFHANPWRFVFDSKTCPTAVKSPVVVDLTFRAITHNG